MTCTAYRHCCRDIRVKEDKESTDDMGREMENEKKREKFKIWE